MVKRSTLPMDELTLARFEAKYVPVPYSGCWLWDAGVCSSGYGTVGVSGRIWSAHRLSYTHHVGPIPQGMQVLHRCDVRACVNPDHLFLGTNADNVADRVAKGRSADMRGVRNVRAKLCPEDVREIRRRLRRGDRQVDIAADYDIPQTQVSRIKLRKSWGHLK